MTFQDCIKAGCPGAGSAIKCAAVKECPLPLKEGTKEDEQKA